MRDWEGVRLSGGLKRTLSLHCEFLVFLDRLYFTTVVVNRGGSRRRISRWSTGEKRDGMRSEAFPPNLGRVAVVTVVGWWIGTCTLSGLDCAFNAVWVLAVYGTAFALAPEYVAAVHEKGGSSFMLALSMHGMVLVSTFPTIAEIRCVIPSPRANRE